MWGMHGSYRWQGRTVLRTIPVKDAQGKKITTIEGLPQNHPVKKAWIQEQVVQCGYCQPGIMMQVAALLSETPKPDAR